VSSLTAGVEWVIKLVMRLIEMSALRLFLKKAKVAFLAERKLTQEASTEPVARGGGFEFTGGASTRTVHTEGGLIHDLERFKKFFQAGCDASPVIAILTLNSGICGSQWQLQSMLSDIEVPGKGTGIAMIGQKEFNSGTAYFKRLREYGYGYLKDCGFSFKADLAVRKPRPPRPQGRPANDSTYIEGLLMHARGLNPPVMGRR
jgi:hypothetical protein